MEDRELLELAAKAAGMGSVLYMPISRDKGDFMVEDFDGGQLKPWNPLMNDGDALRLAVKLNLSPKRFGDLIEVVAPKGSSFGIVCEQGVIGGDLLNSYRRAIVRAAAEIGRDKP